MNIIAFLKKWTLPSGLIIGAVVTEEGILLRRLTKYDRKQETISLHSLNRGDEDRIIALQDVKAFFYVERLIERHLSQW